MQADRILIARLSGIAGRHARWGGLTADQEAAGAAELAEVAAGRVDLLAQEGGISVGFAEAQGEHERARAAQIARLCHLAGADMAAMGEWVAEGRRRREASRGRLPGNV